MADDKSNKAEDTAKVGSKKKLIILVALVLAVLAGGGAGVWVFLGSSSGEEVHDADQKSEQGSNRYDEPGPIVELDPFVVNLADQEQLRYLKMSIKLELDRPEVETDFPEKLPAIRDALLVLFTSKESQTLRTINGKRRMREEILIRANGVMSKGNVTKVFFTDFIIQ